MFAPLTRRLSAPFLTAILVLIAFHAGPAGGQPPKEKAPPKNVLDARSAEPDRDLFMIYAIEEFYRDSVPNRPLTEPPGSPGYDRFVKAREQLVNDLRAHLAAAPARKPLLDRLDEYRALLHRLSRMNKKLMETDAKYRAVVEKYYSEVEKKLKFKRQEYLAFDTLPSMVRAARSARWWWGESRSGRWWWGESPVYLAAVTGYIKSLQADVRVNKLGDKLFAEARRKEVAYWEENRPKLESELKAIAADYEAESREVRATALANLQKTATELGRAKGWRPTETQIDPDGNPLAIPQNARPSDPFLAVWRAREVAKPDVTVPGSVAAATEAAKTCYRARLLVPTEPAYRPFKGLACEVAGQVALAAAATEAGTGGFPKQLANAVREPAELARAAWNEYRNAIGLDILNKRPLLMHQVVMANAYVPGQPRYDAYRLVAQHMSRSTESVTEDPEVWYDFARVCAAQRSGDARVSGDGMTAHERSIYALQRARLFGFDRPAEAKASADFDGLMNGQPWKRAAMNAALDLPIIRAAR